MSDRLLKITYNGGPAGATKKINAYLRMPSNNLIILRREIEMFLFQERHLPQTEIRTYWIDADSDEIEVVNQNDYDIFLAKCEKNMHMQISAVVDEKENMKPEPNADDPSNFIIHDGVECDSCGALPMIGFRYKCVQCPNFDLCQNCEAAHKHPDHLMVRMPTNNGPGIIDAWFSGPGSNAHCHRRSGRRFRGQCPFPGATGASAEATAETAPTAETHKESRRERRHARRGQSFVSQFVDAMFNIPAETPAATTAASAPAANTAASAPAAEEQPKKQPEVTVLPIKTPVVEVPIVVATAEEPVAAPRSKEQPKPEETTTTTTTTPTTPVINLESLAQMVNPEYMRAGIEILNNFSEMFAKMIDPNEAAAFGCADTSMSSQASTVPEAQTASTSFESVATQAAPPAAAPAAVPVAIPAAVPVATPEPAKKIDLEERRRSDSLDQDWQMIDNTAAPMSNVSSTDALINLNNTTSSTTTSTTTTTVSSTAAAAVPPTRDFAQLGEMLRQHVNEEEQLEQQRELTTAHTQTAQVGTVTTSTSTNPVITNSTSTSTTTDAPAPAAPAAKPEEYQIYHNDERINASVHAMMSMGFSNEGAWLTQLLESVEGNIPAALDLMHTSQSGRQ